MPRVQVIRTEVQRLLREAPFQPFVLRFENGDRVIIEHPENIAFDPTAKARSVRAQDFYVFSRNRRVYSTFNAVTSVSLVDQGE